MGTVFEAEHVTLRRRLAAKVLKPQLAAVPEWVARFRREAQIAASLGHDNICDVLDIGSASCGALYFVMPLLRGRSVAEEVGSRGPLELERCLDIVAQVLDALQSAHEAGVVHRDLKPGNVFLTRIVDRDDVVKILDFGVSKVLPDGAYVEQRLTKTGIAIGTPEYMAPEQARALKDQDHRVDIYAAGALLYEMITGQPPFAAEDDRGAVLQKITSMPIISPRARRPDLPESIEEIILRAMARNREERFPSASAMRDCVISSRDSGDPTGVDQVVREQEPFERTWRYELPQSDPTTLRVRNTKSRTIRRLWAQAIAASCLAAVGLAVVFVPWPDLPGLDELLPRAPTAVGTSRPSPLPAPAHVPEAPASADRPDDVSPPEVAPPRDWAPPAPAGHERRRRARTRLAGQTGSRVRRSYEP